MVNKEKRENLSFSSRLFPLSERAILDTKIDFGLNPETACAEGIKSLSGEQPNLYTFLEHNSSLLEKLSKTQAKEQHSKGSAIVFNALRHQARAIGKDLPTISDDQIEAYKEELRDNVKHGKTIPVVVPHMFLSDGTFVDFTDKSETNPVLEKVNKEMQEAGKAKIFISFEPFYDSIQGFFLAQGQELSRNEQNLGQYLNDSAPPKGQLNQRAFFYAGAINVYYPLRRAIEAQDLAEQFKI